MSNPFHKKVAVIDGFGQHAEVHLYWESKEGETREMPWPDDWPSWVSCKFLESKGFEVVQA